MIPWESVGIHWPMVVWLRSHEFASICMNLYAFNLLASCQDFRHRNILSQSYQLWIYGWCLFLYLNATGLLFYVRLGCLCVDVCVCQYAADVLFHVWLMLMSYCMLIMCVYVFACVCMNWLLMSYSMSDSCWCLLYVFCSCGLLTKIAFSCFVVCFNHRFFCLYRYSLFHGIGNMPPILDHLHSCSMCSFGICQSNDWMTDRFERHGANLHMSQKQYSCYIEYDTTALGYSHSN